MDWLDIWGVTKTFGFTFKSLLVDLARDGGKSFVSEVWQGEFENLSLVDKTQIQVVMGKALREFLSLIQQELEYVDVEGENLEAFVPHLQRFIRDKSVIRVLGRAFREDSLDIDIFVLIWRSLDLPSLPDEFNWRRIGKLYLKRVKSIVLESPRLFGAKDLGDISSVTSGVLYRNPSPSDNGNPQGNFFGYRNYLKSRYGNLHLDSIETSGAAYDELKLWKIFIPQSVKESQEFLPQVYELPKFYQSRLQERGEFGRILSEEEVTRYQRVYREEPIRSVLEIVKESIYKYIVILGDPGAGKSMLLQYLALQWAELPEKDLSLQPIPLLVELRSYSRKGEEDENFQEFCYRDSKIDLDWDYQEFQKWLNRGKVILLLDGLDEIFNPVQRGDAITDIINLSQALPNLRIILTSRIIGYQAQRLAAVNFRHFILQDLDSAQINDFIQRWHDLTFYDEWDKQRKRERLEKALKDAAAIRELAGNPLLLTMMAILNRNQELPRDRAELYNQASRVLLHQWDTERALFDANLFSIPIDYQDKQAMLRRVAYYMQTNPQGLAGNLISGADLKRILTEYLEVLRIPEASRVSCLLINQLRERNFILCYLGADCYAFVHRTFLEYFCAWEYVWRFEKERSISIEELKIEVFGKYWRDKSFHEVLRLIAGMIDSRFVGDIIDYLCEEKGESEKFANIFLAAQFLDEVRNRQLITATECKLYDLVKSLVKYDLNYDYDFYVDEAELVREIRTQAVAAIAQGWKDNPDTLPLLKEWVTNDDNWSVRSAAVKAIAQGWKDNPDTLPLLKEWVTNDDDSSVRHAAVEAIAQGWKDNPDTLPLLKERVTNDDDWDVRYAAVEAIAQGWKDNPDTLPLLKEWVTNDDNWDVRYAAVEAIAQGWKDNPDTLPLLKERVTNDDDSSVRHAAVEAIAQGWKDNPDTLPLLKERVTNDDDSDVRRAAVKAIAQGWKDDPDTLPLLKEWVTNDDDSSVRRAAVKAIAQGWKDDPDTLALLKEWVTNNVRKTGRITRDKSP